MASAYRCNKCEKFFDGSADQQAGHNEDLERLLCFILGIKFTPDQKAAPFYVKDLCPDCAKMYCEQWKVTPQEWAEYLKYRQRKEKNANGTG